MAEALGTTAALIDIIDTVRKGMEFIKTIREADEDILRLQKSANRLKNLLEGWEKVLNEGAEDDQMFQMIKNIAKNDPLNRREKDGIRSTSPEMSKRDRFGAFLSRWRSPSNSRPPASREDSAGTLSGDTLTDAPEHTIFTDLNELQKKIGEGAKKREKDSRLYRGVRYALWDKDSMAKLKKEIDSVADEIRHAGEIDSLALQADTNKVLKASIRQNDEERAQREQREAEEERERELEKLEKFLSPLDFTEKEDSFREHDPYGKWFLDGEEFQAWSSGRPWQLFCYGDPGAGKTVISTIARRYLVDKFMDDGNAVLTLFLDKQNEREQTLQNLLGSLANQLIRHLGSRFDPIDSRKSFARYSFKKGKPSVEELENFIDYHTSYLPQTYIIVDALDERREISDDLIRGLKKDQLTVMFTSRTVASRSSELQINCDTCDRQDIKVFWGCMDCLKTTERLKITICLTCQKDGKGCPRNPKHEIKEPRDKFSIEIKTPSTVIEQFVKDKIEAACGTGRPDNRDWDFDEDDDFDVNAGFLGGILRGDDDLRNKLPVEISCKVNSSFLMTARLWERLEGQHNPEEVREILSGPLELGDTYEHDMQRILEKRPRDRELALRVLGWLAYAPRPLSLSELQVALAVREGDRDTPPQGRLTHKKIVLSVTVGLVSIEYDVVKLYHLTAKEYLTSTRDKWFPNAGIELAKVCLAYLNFDEFSEPCLKDMEEEELPARFEQYVFFRYSSQFWGEHVRQCDLGEDSTIRETALRLLRDDDRLDAVVQGASELWDVRRGVNALHVAAFFGLTELVPEMILDGIKVDAQDDRYEQTALIYACRNGHIKTVQKLLGLGADINHRTKRGSRPIFEAVLHDHTETVRILTRSNELNINATHDKLCNATALMKATSRGQIDTVRVLLKAGASPEQQDYDGRTPLMFAVSDCNYPIMELLIANARGSKALNLTNRRGQTALSIAAGNVDKVAVKALLKKHADPMILDMVDGGNVAFRTLDLGKYETAEEETAEKCLDVLQILLNSVPALLLSKNWFGKSLIHAASEMRFTNVLEVLLERGSDINQKANNGQTPLHEACRIGVEKSVEFLLKNGADRHIEDNFGRSPRVVAVQNGQIDLLRLFDEGRDDDDPGDIANDLSDIPAWSLAKQGRIEELAMKIKADPQCVHVEDPDSGYTSLHFAVSNDEASEEMKRKMTEMLLEAGASCDAQNATGSTPLHLIARNGPPEILDLLLAENPDLEITSIWGDSALDTAQGSLEWLVANKLVEATAIVHPTKHDLQKLFFTAVEIGRPKSMQILINVGADVQAMNDYDMKAKDIVLNASYDEGLKREVLSVIKRARSVFHSNPELTKSPVQMESEDEEAEAEAKREWLVRDIIGNAPSPPLSEPGQSEPGSIVVPPRRPMALAERLKTA